MKKIAYAITLLTVLLAFGTGCSTTAHFKIPADHKLMVTDRTVTPDANGQWTSSPFFWSQTGGADYRLFDKNGKLVRTGKLKTKFRVVSIFWPPAALIYWPMGFTGEQYDLSSPADGYMVTETALPNSSSIYTPAPKGSAPAPKAHGKKAKAPKAAKAESTVE